MKSLNYHISVYEKEIIKKLNQRRFDARKNALSMSTLYCLALYVWHEEFKETIRSEKIELLYFTMTYQDNKITCVKMSDLYYRLLDYISKKTFQSKSVILNTALIYFDSCVSINAKSARHLLLISKEGDYEKARNHWRWNHHQIKM